MVTPAPSSKLVPWTVTSTSPLVPTTDGSSRLTRSTPSSGMTSGSLGACLHPGHGGADADALPAHQRGDDQQAQADDEAEDPGAGGEGDDGPAGHGAGQTPEGDRPARGGGEQQGGRRCLAHAHQQQRRYEGYLEHQGHVDQQAQGGCDSDPLGVVAQVLSHRIGADPLDGQSAGETRQHHHRGQADEVAQAGLRPRLQALGEYG